jgi:hypothetical protein
VAASPVTSGVNISVRLKSGIILSGEANTSSGFVPGITLWSGDYGNKVHFESYGANFSMSSYLTPAQNGAVLTAKYRNLAVDGALSREVHFKYTDTGLNGLVITAAADKAGNTILLKLTGEARSEITRDVIINDFRFMPSVAENAGSESDAVVIRITAAKGNVTPPGGGGGGGGTPPANVPVRTVDAPPVVPVVPVVFNDIDNHWGKEYITKLNELGYINGYGDGTFRPDANITRAEFVTIIARMLNLPEAVYNGEFKDVSDGDWYARNVKKALIAGIISRDEFFRPGDNIRRDELTKIAVGAYLTNNSPPDLYVPLSVFSDADLFEPWAAEFIRIGVTIGIVEGDGAGRFLPGNVATRAEASAVLARSFDFN